MLAMKVMLPTLAAILRLQLLLICSCEFVFPMPPLRRNIIKVRASGFLPFESDLVLPLGILRQLQAQERVSRVLPHQAHPGRRRPKPKVKQQVRLERAHADAGIQMYNLIDDDGELLLNLRVHKETGSKFSQDTGESSWRPSKWRPTTHAPRITSSSPRPLPLHQYLSGNSLEPSTLTQQRRRFGARPDWIYK